MSHRVRQLFQAALAVALFISLVPFGAAYAQDSQSKPQDIVDTAVAAGSFNTLVQAVQAAGLVDTLKGEGPFTVFAPTDEAFAAVPADALSALLADPKALSDVLLYHVVPGAVKSTDLTDGMTATTAQGEDVTFGVSADGVKVNDANVVVADVMASNGVIHVIDKVILPPSMTAAAEAAPAEAAAEEAAPAADIVDTAVAAGSFNTLVQAVQAAGLVDTLKGEGPFTVFAPTDEAFAAVPADALNALLADPKALSDVLLYHVVPGAVKSTDLTDGMTATTAQGEDVTFGVTADGVKVNDANVVAADVMAANGVIHVIDKVILPPSMTAAAAEAAPAESAPAATTEGPTPETMPVTGGETNNLAIFMVLGLVLVVGAGLLVARRRLA